MPPPPLRPRFPVGPRPIAITLSPRAPIPPAVLPIPGPSAPLVPAVVPAVPLDPTQALRARFEALVAELQELGDQMSRNVHRCGTILRELSSESMLAAGELTSFDQLLERYHLPSRLSASKFMTVAEHLDEDQCAQLGVERAYQVVRGAALLPRPIAPRVLLTQNPVIQVGPATMKLQTAPLRALLGWVQGLETPTPALPKRAFRDADSVRDKLDRRLTAAGIGEPKMRLHRSGDRYVLRIELEMDQAEALVAAVRKKG